MSSGQLPIERPRTGPEQNPRDPSGEPTRFGAAEDRFDAGTVTADRPRLQTKHEEEEEHTNLFTPNAEMQEEEKKMQRKKMKMERDIEAKRSRALRGNRCSGLKKVGGLVLGVGVAFTGTMMYGGRGQSADLDDEDPLYQYLTGSGSRRNLAMNDEQKNQIRYELLRKGLGGGGGAAGGGGRARPAGGAGPAADGARVSLRARAAAVPLPRGTRERAEMNDAAKA